MEVETGGVYAKMKKQKLSKEITEQREKKRVHEGGKYDYRREVLEKKGLKNLESYEI